MMRMQKKFELRIFAYYYPWYTGPEDPKWQYCREFCPYLGLYDSSDPAVIRQHIEWAIEHDIEGFLVEWFGEEPPANDAPIDKNLAILRQILLDYPDFKFAVFYDQVIRFGGPKGIRFANPGKRAQFLEDITYAARTNFDHPNYLHINNRPVVVIYLTHFASDDYSNLLEEARERCDNQGSGRPFLIGDEIWWRERNTYFSALDGITSYSLLRRPQMEEFNVGVRGYSQKCAELYLRAQYAANVHDTLLIPHIGHAFNDGNFRGNLPLIPTVEPGKLPDYRGDVIECIKSMSIVWQENPYFRNTGQAFLFVNSFNEWPERSVVEPTLEIETYNKLYDFTSGKYLYLQPPRFDYLEGLKSGKQIMESNVLPNL